MQTPLTIDTNPDPREVQALAGQLYEHGVARTGHSDGQEYAILLRDAGGAIRGGIYGWTWAGWLEVRYLWLHEELRGRGHGTQLLAAVEEMARARGCHTAILETHSYQAPAFYERHGYRAYAVLEDYPPGHRKLFYRKSLLDHRSRGPDGSDQSPPGAGTTA